MAQVYLISPPTLTELVDDLEATQEQVAAELATARALEAKDGRA